MITGAGGFIGKALTARLLSDAEPPPATIGPVDRVTLLDLGFEGAEPSRVRELAAGRPFTCPASAQSTTWLMSVPWIVDNLLHAASLSRGHAGRAWTLPALRSSMRELVEAIAAVYGSDRSQLVRFESHPDLEANFGRQPPLFTPAADAAGFRHDGDLDTLVRRALQPLA